MSKLTQEYLKECLYYNKDTGTFIWKKRPIEHFGNTSYSERICNMWNGKFCGIMAGKVQPHGRTKYIYISITTDGERKIFSAHRLAWLYTHGSFPMLQLDHIDGNGLNNIISNLRDVTFLENCKNRRLSSKNTSGFTGVYWVEKSNKWLANIYVNGKRIRGGLFLNIGDAIEKRKQMNIEYGFHENHGKI